MSDLSGKKAFVTGSVQGIGLAIAKALGGAGARVALHGWPRQKRATQLAPPCGRQELLMFGFSGEICAMSVQLMHL